MRLHNHLTYMRTSPQALILKLCLRWLVHSKYRIHSECLLWTISEHLHKTLRQRCVSGCLVSACVGVRVRVRVRVFWWAALPL